MIWSGVAPYLQPEGVSATLRWMAAQAPGSVLVFDYCWQEYVDGELDHLPGAGNLRRRVEAQGEPLLWGIPKGQAAECMADHGLELLEDVGGEGEPSLPHRERWHQPGDALGLRRDDPGAGARGRLSLGAG